MSEGRGGLFRPAPRPHLLARLIPLAGSLRGYGPGSAVRDAVAAATVVAVAVPAGLGYAEVAGVPPVSGLYALLVPTAAYALLGTSRQVMVGPEGALVALVGALVLARSGEDGPELAATLALLVAGLFLLARALRLSWLADYLSRPVLIGYMHGIVVVLVCGQLGKLLGLDVAATEPVGQLVESVRELGSASGATILVSAVALGTAFTLRAVAPRVPAALLLVVGGIAVSSAADLGAHGVALIGTVPSGMPRITLPTPSFAATMELVPTAAGLFLLAFAEGVLTARTFAGRHGQHVDAGQEMLALGAANAAAGITQGFPVGASNSRSAVNDAAGVRTQLAGLLAAGMVAGVLLFLTGPLADLPTAILGAVIVVAATGLIDLDEWRELARADRVELAIAGVAAAGVVVVGVLPAVAFAVGLSIVDVVRRSARPHDAVLGWVPRLGRWADAGVHPSAELTPGVVVYRLDDRLFFANAGYVKARVLEAVRGAPTPTRWLVFDAEAVAHVDIAAGDALVELTHTLADDGVTLVFARVKTPVRRQLDDTGVLAVVGAEHLHPTVHAAVAACSAAGAG